MIEKNVIGYSRSAEEAARVLVICGTHGDETAAIKTCWYLLNKIQQSHAKDKVSYKFIFMANDNAVGDSCNRCIGCGPSDGLVGGIVRTNRCAESHGLTDLQRS